MVVRRTVLKAIARTSVATVFAGKLTGLSAIAADAVPLRVRRNLHGMKMDDPDLSAYREFVHLMKTKHQTQPLSWLGFANQHGSLNGGFKYCPHGDWYFLPWHRGFVLMYERAVAALTGYKSFAMPYWNWTEDRLLPEAFSAKTYNGKTNPLYVSNRNDLTGPYALTDAIVGQKEVMTISTPKPTLKSSAPAARSIARSGRRWYRTTSPPNGCRWAEATRGSWNARRTTPSTTTSAPSCPPPPRRATRCS